MGCPVTVELDNGEITSIAGNTCKRGETYARNECTNPKRSLTTTVKVIGGECAVVPCKSSGAIPKGKIMECADFIRGVQITAPVKIGDVLVNNILGTGINIVATNNCEEISN